MRLLAMLGLVRRTPDAMPAFIGEIRDVRGVRVVRLRGPIGKEVGREVAAAVAAVEAAERSKGLFSRSVLFDFKETTGWDFSTVAYLVQELRKRMAAHAQVGIVNPSAELLADLEIAKVKGWFHVFASEDEALAELSRTGPRS